MVAAQFVPGSAFVKLYWSNATQLAINVLGCRVTGAPTFDQTLANAIGTAVKTAFQGNFANMVGTNVNLARVGVRDFRSANLPEFRDTTGISPGTAAGDTLPTQTAFVVTLRTAKVGKSFRGRIYLPGGTELTSGATGVASSAFGTAAVNFVSAIDSALQAQGLKLAVISRPAERQTTVVTTFHNDGTQTVRTKSSVTQKAGEVNSVTLIESRNLGYETQRRRNNSRGLAPTALDAFLSMPAPGAAAP